MPADERRCGNCRGSMVGLRRDATYCGRPCKSAASDRRRRADGRMALREAERYERHKPKRKALAREIYWRNHEVYVQRSRDWRKNNPTLKKLQGQARRARRLGNPGFAEVTPAQWRRELNRHDGKCVYCGQPATTVDHVIPLCKGGRHAIGNLVPACTHCNSSKSGLLLSEWRHRAP